MNLQEELDAVLAELKEVNDTILKCKVQISDGNDRIAELNRKARAYEKLIQQAKKLKE